MSDEHSQRTVTDSSESAADAEADGGAGGTLEPSGGPQRVVSDQSVDDILDSLDATKSESTDSSGTGTESKEVRTEPNETVTTEFDEDEIPADDDPVPDGDTDTAGSGQSAVSDADSTDDSDPDTTAAIDSAASSLSETARPDEDISSETDDSIEDDIPGEDDASLEELAARIEDGAVTGADVRAAEAGEGRDSTPDVDEIELSMDDLEATQAESTGPARGRGPSDAPDSSGDAGPLAGSVRPDGDDSSDAESDEKPGLLGRIKRLFGG